MFLDVKVGEFPGSHSRIIEIEEMSVSAKKFSPAIKK